MSHKSTNLLRLIRYVHMQTLHSLNLLLQHFSGAFRMERLDEHSPRNIVMKRIVF